MATFHAILAELRRRRNVARQTAQDRDERRGYAIDKKRVILAYLAESVIVVASLYGAWLFAKFYGHDDWRQMQMMLLAPLGYAVIEFCRVPLAISVRTHGSWLVKTLAILGVIAATGVTVKSMSQLGEIMFRPRLFDVVRAEEVLGQAQASQASISQQIMAADATVADRRQTFQEAEQRAKSDAIQLASLPKDQCQATSGVTKDGRPWKGQTCKSDPRIIPLRDNLKTTVAARDDLARRLDEAVKARTQLDRAPADHTLATAQADYRDAILHSQLHSFTGMVFGKSTTEVTNQEIHQFLRIFVFVPAIFVAFASTLIAFTAVHRLRPQLIPFEPDGTEYLLDPLYRHVVDEAVQRVHTTHQNNAAAIGARV